MRGILILSLVGAMFWRAGPVGADGHAIAMHDRPKYPPGFAHFDYVEPAAPKGGRLRLAAIGGFDSLNPFIIKGTPAAGLHLSFEALLTRAQDEPFSLYGLLARQVVVAPDRSWIEFRLHPAARFADGRPVTVDDVIFSYRTLREEGRPNLRLYYREVARVERIGLDGVRFVFAAAGNRELALIMGLMPVLPSHAFRDRPFARTTLRPIPGSGPYAIAAVDPGRSIRYRRRPDYWGRDLPVNLGRYNFDTVEYTYFRDSGVALEAFKADAYDLRRETDPARWATGYALPAARGRRMRRESVANGRPAGMRGFVFNSRRRTFADPRVRSALAHAFDFAWVNRVLFHGAYRRTESYFANSDLAARGPPGPAELALLAPWRDRLPAAVFERAYAAPSGPLRANLAAAFRLLGEAGWTVRDGVLIELASGRPMAFEILLHDPRAERVALAFARNLKRLGVAARVRTVDAAEYEARRRSFDFDVILNHWYQSLSPGVEQRYYWGADQADVAGTRNYAGVRDPVIDALLDPLTAARSRADLRAATRALDRVLLWSHYVVPLYHARHDRIAYWDRLAHPAVVPIYGHQLTTWWSVR